jgi:hypothetical protein
MSEDPGMGALDPDTAAIVEQAAIGHRLDAVELDEAISYRDEVIARTSARMRATRCTEEEIAAMVDDALRIGLFWWVLTLRATGDYGPWHD